MMHQILAVSTASDIALPGVPVGISPVLQYVLGLVGIVISVFLPLVAVWFKQYLAQQNVQSRAGLINGSIVRAAHLADFAMTQQGLTVAEVRQKDSPVMQQAIDYVAQSHPDAIAATPEASNEHIRDAITATLQQIQTTKAATTPPSVILSPVSALR